MATELADTPKILHLSLVTGGALRDSDGQRLGRVDDLIVRLSGTGYPPITGLLVTVAGRQAYLPSDRLADLAPGEAVLSKAKLDLRPFERRPEEVLLKHDVLDHQLINVEGARLVRANEVELARVEGWWRVVGVDTGPRGGLRRLLPQTARAQDRDRRVPRLGQRRALRRRCRLRPPPRPPSQAGKTPPGSDRRPSRGRLPQRGRGDHPGGRPGRPASSRPTSSRSWTSSTSWSSSSGAPTSRWPP